MKDRVLVIDDDQNQCDLFEVVLKAPTCEVTTTTSPSAGLEHAKEGAFDVVLTDLGMTEMDGLELCRRMLGTSPDVPIVVITGQNSLDAAVNAMRAGAYDFLTKPVDAKVLQLTVARAIEHRRLHSQVRQLRAELLGAPVSDLLIGDSSAMKNVSRMITRIASNDASVLIQGETGTGKELVAKALHQASPRARGPFVAINCAAVPASLLESELFGHARGAFTDAKTQRDGLFVQASGGTLLLDEIGDMALEMQAKLLRALQERKVRPVGANAEVSFDVRIIAATHRDLETEIEQRRFREDLFYRVNVVRIDVPPLRARDTDILKLASVFLGRFAERNHKDPCSLSPQAAERLLSYDWPGNVRELENAMERAVALARLDTITVEDLPQKIRAYDREHCVIAADSQDDILPLDAMERRYIFRVLRLVGGNKTRAAELLGLDRRTLHRKLERYQGDTTGGDVE
ncbi:MAG TPA: sigma-54 dependent transcriptional regulator [Polyangiaceae bacterium]|nr:sigma-54 dependent transcriptional regulator [Polyangiaceae bacterium]